MTFVYSFEQVLKITLKFEGGWSRVPADRGGETYAGISRKGWPAWPGWALVDEGQRGGAALEAAVAAFYEENFWRPWAPLEAAGLNRLRAKLFDASVHVGLAGGVRLLQRALNRLGRGLAVDGRLGPLTLAAAEGADEELWLTLVSLEQAEHYRRIVAADPSQAIFEKGWLRRARWRP